MRRIGITAVTFAALLIPGARAQQQTPPSKTETPSTAPPQQTMTPRQVEEMRADLFMARKDYSSAVAAYEKLLKDDPRNVSLLNRIGIAYQQQLLFKQAEHYYKRAIKANKNFASAYNNLGTIEYQRKKYGRAIKQYVKAVTLEADVATFYSNLGYAYFSDRKYDLAMTAFHKALGLDPLIFERSSRTGSLLMDRSVEQRGLFYFFLAKAFAAMGDAPHCAENLRKARDEGYKGLDAAKTDPAFAGVLRDPDVRSVLQLPPLPQTPPHQPPSGPHGA